MTLIGKLISLFIGSLHMWVCSDCALQTHVCPLMFPRRGGMKWPASKKPSKKTSKKQKKTSKVGNGQRNPSFRDLRKERLGEVTRDEWQRSGLGFLIRFQTMKALSAASATKRKSKGNDSQHVWGKLWFNLLWLVVWNIFYFSIYWEFHNPNWRTPSFFRGVGIPPTSTGIPSWSQIRLLQIASNVNVVNLGAESEPCSVCSW